MAEEVLLERWTEIEAKANKEPEQFFSVGESLERGHQAFDAAVLEVSFEEQALVCTMRVQDALRARSDVRLALELLRPARLLWPNKFGAPPEPPAPAASDEAAAAPSPEDPAAAPVLEIERAAKDLRADLDALREIFMVDLSAPRADLIQRLGTPVKKLLVLPSEGSLFTHTHTHSLSLSYTYIYTYIYEVITFTLFGAILSSILTSHTWLYSSIKKFIRGS